MIVTPGMSVAPPDETMTSTPAWSSMYFRRAAGWLAISGTYVHPARATARMAATIVGPASPWTPTTVPDGTRCKNARDNRSRSP